MPREIKFRAWNGEQMSDPFTLEDCCNECGTYIGTQVSMPGSFRMDACEVMQFTGLLDKTGREIYEGDIVIQQGPIRFLSHDKPEFLNECTGIIVFYKGSFMVDYKNSSYRISLNVSDNSLEVTGNIYENPELLSEK